MNVRRRLMGLLLRAFALGAVLLSSSPAITAPGTPQSAPASQPTSQPSAEAPTSRPHMPILPHVRLAPLSRALEETQGDRKETRDPTTGAREATSTKKRIQAEVHAPDPLAERVAHLEGEVHALRQRLEKTREPLQRGIHGLGPGASRVYGSDERVSLGGYGEFYLAQQVSDRQEGEDFNIGSFTRYVQYLGARFTDRLLVNVALQLQHATTAAHSGERGGSVALEFASLEYLAHPWINLRAGLLLMPLGLINPVHEPPFFHGNLRPEVETRIIPSTWRELGLGVFGEPAEGLSYALYLVNGLTAGRFSEAGWRDGRQNGSRALVEDFAFILSLNYRWYELLHVGGSVYYGGADQGQLGQLTVNTLLIEGHVQLHWAGVELRALASYGALSNSSELSRAIYGWPEEADANETRLVGSESYGWYAELAYDLWPWLAKGAFYLAPYFRYERLDTQASVPDIAGRSKNPDSKRRVIEAGLSFKPHPQIVLKGSYRNINSSADTPIADSYHFGAGFVY
jgi:hypothetical protein